MAEKKQDAGFTVTDRRLFTTDGELRSDLPEEKPSQESTASATAVATPKSDTPTANEEKAPPPPTAAEQKANAEAYQKSSKDLDARVELSGHSAKELEITFERFMASLYMSAMMQMGMMPTSVGPALATHLADGGSALVLLDPNSEALTEALAPWGVGVKSHFIAVHPK